MLASKTRSERSKRSVSSGCRTRSPAEHRNSEITMNYAQLMSQAGVFWITLWLISTFNKGAVLRIGGLPGRQTQSLLAAPQSVVYRCRVLCIQHHIWLTESLSGDSTYQLPYKLQGFQHFLQSLTAALGVRI